MDATLIPLPNELTTPPVTKMNFVGICLHKNCGLGRGSYRVIYRPNRRPNGHAKRYSESKVIQGCYMKNEVVCRACAVIPTLII